MRRITIVLALVAGLCLAFHVASAAQTKPSATIELKGGSVAAGVGVSWGSGTLVYKGKRYPITATGFDVGDVGVTNITASGTVYGLKNLDDFDGTYAGVGAAASVGGGAKTETMQNQKGVRVHVASTTQGIQLALGPGGVSMSITRH
ncbi:MAG: hypothetical protein HY271_04630 [Deltaproteobacteria bacterium]|nr:hypothetical protein [Deltaproteobacteria bacterium]